LWAIHKFNPQKFLREKFSGKSAITISGTYENQGSVVAAARKNFCTLVKLAASTAQYIIPRIGSKDGKVVYSIATSWQEQSKISMIGDACINKNFPGSPRNVADGQL
jgi:hypothetical protein